MTTENKVFTFAAPGTQYAGQGRIWYIKSAPVGPLSITCRKMGAGASNVRVFSNMPAGAKFKAEIGDGWDILEITSASAQVCEIIYGDDDVEIAQAVSITGNASTVERPSATITNTPAITTIVGQAAAFPANLNRRRITVTNRSTSTDSVYFRTSGGGNNLIEIQPGMGYTFETTAAMDYVATSVTNELLIFEES